VTTDLTPVTTRRVRLTFRCDKQNPIDGKQPGDPVWLDEVEVFARVSPLEAWARRLFPDR
jgi:hypothetical protein